LTRATAEASGSGHLNACDTGGTHGYSHPGEAVVEFRDDGWSAEAIADFCAETLAQARQPYGLQLHELELS